MQKYDMLLGWKVSRRPGTAERIVHATIVVLTTGLWAYLCWQISQSVIAQ